jgi:hypothetical protein
VLVSLGVVLAILAGSVILSIVFPKKEAGKVPASDGPSAKKEKKD